jgi:hypothetical protein
LRFAELPTARVVDLKLSSSFFFAIISLDFSCAQNKYQLPSFTRRAATVGGKN